MNPLIVSILQDQVGVVSRAQLLAAGCDPHDIERMLRRRELSRMHAGVFLDHTGTPTWLQSAWGAVLVCWPAALYGASAARAVEGPGSGRATTFIHVAVAGDRRVASRDGVKVHRVERLDDQVLWATGPPRQRYEEAVLELAASASSDMASLGELARAVQGRRTTAARLRVCLDGRTRIARRQWIAAVLDDVAAGACSVLEHGYLTAERRHGITGAGRQVADRLGAGTVFRDVEYACGLVVELDGRLFHDTTEQRDRDFDRDLDLRADGRDSVRLSWGQVFDRPCWTMARIVVLLRARGWDGTPRPCNEGCPVGA